MLVRKLKRGDSLVIGNVAILVRRASDSNLILAIAAPDHIEVVQGRDGAVLHSKTTETPPQ